MQVSWLCCYAVVHCHDHLLPVFRRAVPEVRADAEVVVLHTGTRDVLQPAQTRQPHISKNDKPAASGPTDSLLMQQKHMWTRLINHKNIDARPMWIRPEYFRLWCARQTGGKSHSMHCLIVGHPTPSTAACSHAKTCWQRSSCTA